MPIYSGCATSFSQGANNMGDSQPFIRISGGLKVLGQDPDGAIWLSQSESEPKRITLGKYDPVERKYETVASFVSLELYNGVMTPVGILLSVSRMDEADKKGQMLLFDVQTHRVTNRYLESGLISEITSEPTVVIISSYNDSELCLKRVRISSATPVKQPYIWP